MGIDRIREWCAGRLWQWRLPLLLILFVQGTRPLRSNDMQSIFSGIIFGSHEFGHLFFAFFGQWIGIAGGSFMQLLIPLGAAAVVLRSRDWFGAAVCGIFLAASFGNLSWYIADARSQDLDLVSFSPDGAIHDWNYLLHSMGLLHHDLRIAGLARGIGWLLLFASTVFSLQLFLWMATIKKEEASESEPIN